MLILLDSALTRPHLEYYNQFWVPQFREDINKLKNIQRRAARMGKDLESIPYMDHELRIFSLEKRRLGVL